MNWSVWMMVAIVAGGAAVFIHRWSDRAKWKLTCRVLVFGLGMAGVLALVAGAYLAMWFFGRSSNESRRLFEGVDYRRIVGDNPGRFVAHLVFVDLRSTNLSFVVTPAEGEGTNSLKASTVGEFLK